MAQVGVNLGGRADGQRLVGESLADIIGDRARMLIMTQPQQGTGLDHLAGKGGAPALAALDHSQDLLVFTLAGQRCGLIIHEKEQ